jgi:hypothetical protein
MIELKLTKIDITKKFKKFEKIIEKSISLILEQESKLIFNKSLKYLDRQIFFYNFLKNRDM